MMLRFQSVFVAFLCLPFAVATSLTPAAMAQERQHEIGSGNLRVSEESDGITIRDRGRKILVYNKQSPPVPEGMDPIFRRSGFLHPVLSPKGKVVTATFPADHAHQHGIFTAWVSTTWNGRELDFWNSAKGSGRVVHDRVLSTFADDEGVGFEVEMIHQSVQEPVVDVLRERWRITASPTDGSYHVFDLATTQSALTDIPLIIQKFHYGGVAVRGPMEWLSPEDSDQRANDGVAGGGCHFLNDQGSDRIQGNHQKSRWVAMSGHLLGDAVTITVLGHSGNPRAPQAARLHPTKPYFCFAPCVEGSFVIDQDHPFHGRYRFLVTDAEPDADWIEEEWNRWNQSMKSNQALSP